MYSQSYFFEVEQDHHNCLSKMCYMLIYELPSEIVFMNITSYKCWRQENDEEEKL